MYLSLGRLFPSLSLESGTIRYTFVLGVFLYSNLSWFEVESFSLTSDEFSDTLFSFPLVLECYGAC